MLVERKWLLITGDARRQEGGETQPEHPSTASRSKEAILRKGKLDCCVMVSSCQCREPERLGDLKESTIRSEQMLQRGAMRSTDD